MSDQLTPLQVFARESLKVLTDKQREIWLLQREMTQEEIASTLGISQSSVSKHFKAAEKRIRKFGKAYKKVFDAMQEAIPKETIELDYGEQARNGWVHKTPIRPKMDKENL